ncbi:SusC/RagA family TonB-linked outer membrane protein [Chitinophaga silvisoli]|uniref:TonB-dependent receptor n=1 Tax=Chitinophaga silvisoli TaxID=2291814 RepID=A0A3E1P377_9BACT|nr:TonB-dependent receptor [Chitinophaga silvisoli]RFM34564.1 TonB-dependent receptor [Chitinophaga silvisoli]
MKYCGILSGVPIPLYERFQLLFKIMRILFLVILVLCTTTLLLVARDSRGQDLSAIRLHLSIRDTKLDKVLKQIERHTELLFIVDGSVAQQTAVPSLEDKERSLKEILDAVLGPNELAYVQDGHYIIIKKSAPAVAAKPVSGVITDEKGEPLPGVSISIKGSHAGTISNEKGIFTLNSTSENDTLLVSYVGYKTQEVPVKGMSQLTIRLALSENSLQDVVVIGYGSQRKGDLTSSVATVKSENFVKGNVLDAGQLLQGKVAGLTVSAPSGDPTSGSQILLRGNTTLLGANSSPLVLIDGIPGDLKTVAPEDIESMDVLKDGSAAAIYGTRGTNGVIIVTTRRPSGAYTNSVDYSGYVGTQTVARKLEMLTAEDYRRQIAEGTRDKSWDLGANTDWQKEISQTPVTHVHNLTFRGGNSRTNYLANVNYRALEGIMKKSDNNTFTGRIDINHSMLDDKLRINVGLLNSNNKFTTTGDGYSFNGYTYRQALIRNPTSPIYDSTGKWFEQTGLFNYENPLSRLYESNGQNTSQNTRMNSTITLLPVEGLKLSALFSYTRYNEERGYSETKQHISTLRDGRNGYASVGSLQNVQRLMELTAQYNKNIAKHKFSVMGGYSYQETDYRNQYMQNWDFPTDRFSYNDIGIGYALKQGLAVQYSEKSETNLIGFFGRATYSYDDKYLLLASLRHEAASQLYGTKQPWGNFPAVSLGWRLSNEPFMKRISWLTDLKLRAGYGVTGTQPTDLFLGVGILSYGDYVYNNGVWIQTLGPSQNPNDKLRWEEKHESNFGIDYTLFNGRVSGNVDYYIRRINGLLYDYAVPSPPNLYNSTRANVGKMENKGLEVMVNIIPVKTNDFEWSTSLMFSTNTNKLITLSNELYQASVDYITTGSTGEPIQSFTNIVRVGRNIGDFYGFKVVDISSDGKWIYEGRDGKPQAYADYQHAFEDKRVLGNGLPRYYGGWNNTFRYKNFDLNITMRGAFKYQILNVQRMYYENTGLQQYNRLKSAYDKVMGKAVLSTDMPLEFNSNYVENGDFWKVDNITLGYNFNRIQSKYIHGARVYASTLNTLTLTGYKGIDPEVNRLGLAPGVDDRDKYPAVRTFTVGVNLNF